MQDFQRKHPDIACLLVIQHAEGAKQLLSKKKFDFGCSWDENGRLARKLNAFFLPRFYLLDGVKRVRYIQAVGTDSNAVFSEIVATVRNHG